MVKWSIQDKIDYIEIKNKKGKSLGISKLNMNRLIEVDGLLFKDLNQSGILEPYKDWRLPYKERAEDLSKRLDIRAICGLMLYSSHQTVTNNSSKYKNLFGENTYDGKLLYDSAASVSDLSDQQKAFLFNDNVRHILISTIDSKKEGAKWTNNIQEFCEGLSFGIPANICSDPRHGIESDAEYNLGSGSDISKWPEEIGLAATFDSKVVHRFGEILAEEYRSLGITTALSPQIDLATDPRWRRYSGTFGEHTQLVTDMAEAYCDGVQTSLEDAEEGWGLQSVNTMVKHWPGGGSGEGGRDAHYAYGKYAVYPGKNFAEHMIPFTEGAFKLSGKTKKASAVMPYYTISYGQDNHYQANVGNSFSKYIIQDLLRENVGYDGVVCTDWLVTDNHGPSIKTFSGKCWGVETLSIAERHFKAIEAGVDQFGGNNDIQPVLEAYGMYVEKYGNEKAENRFRQSAYRILLNIYHTGLFENPYVDVNKAKEIVGNVQFTEEGYAAQLKSAILLKNKRNVLPISKGKKVYIPYQINKENKDWFGNIIPEKTMLPINSKNLSNYYDLTSNPDDADFAMVFMNSPISDGYIEENGRGKYIPISLQYRPYKSVSSRKKSLASGDPLEECDRSYYQEEAFCENAYELETLVRTRQQMGNKPVIVCLNMKKPCLVSEIDPMVDGLIIHFGIQDRALFDLISGDVVPSGLLPFQIPKNMEVVELQNEDVGLDMDPYIDELGSVYDFAYGRNYDNMIQDERVHKYRR